MNSIQKKFWDITTNRLYWRWYYGPECIRNKTWFRKTFVRDILEFTMDLKYHVLCYDFGEHRPYTFRDII